VAIIIAGGSMSEEYEHGTTDILLSKPIRRLEYLAGKFLGGFSLLIVLEAIMVAIGVLMGFVFFGPQNQLEFAPVIYVAIAYSSLLFFSLAFMFSEVLRRGTLAMLAAIGVFIASEIVSTVLIVLYNVSGMHGPPVQLYLDISRALPTWSAGSLPTFIAKELMPMLNNPLVGLVSGDIGLAAGVIAAYMVASITVAVIRLSRSDITKRAD
jgi:ABC-2 type transport system permease protein